MNPNQNQPKNLLNSFEAIGKSRIIIKGKTTQEVIGSPPPNTDTNKFTTSDTAKIKLHGLEQRYREAPQNAAPVVPVDFRSKNGTSVPMDRNTLQMWAPEFGEKFKNGNNLKLEVKTEPLQALVRFCEAGRADSEDVELLLKCNRQVGSAVSYCVLLRESLSFILKHFPYSF